MTKSRARATSRPPLVLRVLAAIGVILLGAGWGLPIVVAAALFGLALSASFVQARPPGPFSETMFASVVFVVLAFAAFVISAFVLRIVLNLAGRTARSALKWLAVSWLLAGPVVVWTSGVAVERVGGTLGAALWLAFAFALAGGWLVFAAIRAVWAAGQRSTFAAVTLGTAALLLVVLPAAVLAALPPFVERVKRLRDAQPPVHELFAHSSTPPSRVNALAARSPDGEKAREGSSAGESAASTCYAQLAGDPCDDVWHRTLQDLGNHSPDTNDALQAAFLYVCLEKPSAPPKLCGAFRRKAERWKIDAWRRTRRFRDQPAETEPACPLPSAENQAITQEELDFLDDASARLDERSRRILHLAYWEGLTDAVIGTQLGLSTVRIRVLRREAEQRLAHFLMRCR